MSEISHCAYLGDVDTSWRRQPLLPFLPFPVAQQTVDLPSSGHSLEPSYVPLLVFWSFSAPSHGECRPYYGELEPSQGQPAQGELLHFEPLSLRVLVLLLRPC
jgi:hypothetical protein